MEEVNRIRFHLGTLGAWLPIFILIAFMMVMAFTGNVTILVFSVGAFIALVASFLLTKDKKLFQETVLGSFKKDTLAVIVMAFLLAGILSQLLIQSGLINGLLWLTELINLNAGFIPLITFLTCCLISTSCGTTAGTVTAVTPVMLPLAVGLGVDPGVVMGAIISGSIFGDNLAPISDTTIASALTQEAEIKDVVRTRLPYSLIGGSIASILYVIVGLKTTETTATASAGVDSAYAPTLALLLILVALVALMLKGWDLISTLLICILLGIVINISFGFIGFTEMFSAEGPIGEGLASMLNITLFVILLFTVIEIMERSGVFEELVQKIMRASKTPRGAELSIAGITASGNIALSASVTNIIFVGPFVRKIAKKFNLDRTRGANIMDGLSTGISGMLPYNSSFLVAMGLAVSSGAVGGNFSFIDVVPYTFHSMMLIILFILSIITGIGRSFENNQETEEVTRSESIR